jgi:hypothetical protein
MTGNTDEMVGVRKSWAAPELKKVDVEQITAGGTGGGSDSHGRTDNKKGTTYDAGVFNHS